MPFRALGLEQRILRAIQEAGYTEPTPIQQAAIPPILTGQDLIGIAQTGTGKTAAFTLPLLTRLASELKPSGPAPAGPSGTAPSTHPASQGQLRGTRTLILAPTRELAVQIDENVRAYGRHLPFRIATVFGGVGERPQIEALRSGANIIIACPGRLLDLMGRRFADFTNLQHLVLDEADRMLDMGFLPSIRQIVRSLPRERQTLLFSATLSKEIEALTRDFQRNPKLIQIGRRSNPAETVSQWVYEVPKALKPALLVHLLQGPDMNMVLVFSRMKHGADRIARHLEQRGIPTATLHSNRSQNQRLRALQDFKSGQVRVLVATDIAARGIDVDGISHVVNYDFPPHAEDYVHRIGRTGRAQAIGDAISFVTPEDHGALRSLERFIGRGIVRRRAEGFDLSAPAPAAPAARPSHSSHSSHSSPSGRSGRGSFSGRRSDGDNNHRRSSSGSTHSSGHGQGSGQGHGRPAGRSSHSAHSSHSSSSSSSHTSHSGGRSQGNRRPSSPSGNQGGPPPSTERKSSGKRWGPSGW